MENMMPYLNNYVNDKDISIIDMDTQERIRSLSECSMSGTSGYNSTTSPGPNNSPISSDYSPVRSPDSALQTEFSNLTIPTISYQQTLPQYTQLQNVHLNVSNIGQSMLYQQNQNIMNSANLNFGNPINCPQFSEKNFSTVKYEYQAALRITEQPVEKFRFRYKSEMHGTHGSLNGANSQRNTKSFPEVELFGYDRPAIIRCSLFQTNLESPHSHQLVVRKDDHDICDPHELKVSQELGYFAEFKNMGIIHTAKKFIVEELLKKKRKRLLFELGHDVLTTKQEQELHKQTEKEAKDMNLNQVRLCFEAFRVEENNTYTPIAAPIYSNPINNRKSAQTGELRITRLSIATGNVGGDDDLILLVEKVSKKNIKVRFYEMIEDEQVWEAFATFRESDVHHQYAIVCRTPPYKDKEIDKPVDVFIELVRPSDDERSYPPVIFRYKPSYAVISRKRRRTYSSITGSSCSNSGSLSSGEIPKTVQEQSVAINGISDELNHLLDEKVLSKSDMSNLSSILAYLDDPKFETNIGAIGHIEKDGVCDEKKSRYHYKKQMISKKKLDMDAENLQHMPFVTYLERILNIFNDTVRSSTPPNSVKFNSAAEQINKIFHEHSVKNGESLIHEIVVANNFKLAIPIFKVLEYFKLNKLLSSLLNKRNQTALHYACLHNKPDYIRPLLRFGCNPDIQDIEGNSALHIAVREKQLRCLESFLHSEMTLNLNIKNDDGFTPLHLAIRDNNYEIVAKMLKYNGTIVVEQYSKDGNNALHMSIQQQNIKLVQLVLNNNSLISSLLYAYNTAGYTPLDLAKQLLTNEDQSQQILNLLLTFYNKYPSLSEQSKMNVASGRQGNDKEHKPFIKKEEDNSSTSTEDDEDDSITNKQSHELDDKKNTFAIMEESKIKKEFLYEIQLDVINLEKALNDKEVIEKLCIQLNKNDRWKEMAAGMKMLRPYFTNAEAFLNSLKRNLKDINSSKFFSTLDNIDKDLINLFRNK